MGQNRYVMTVLFAVAMPPFYYAMLASPYGKSGTFSIVSCSLVPLTVIRSNGIPGTILDSFAKRVIALLIGGAVTVLVQSIIFPKKARALLHVELINTLKYSQLLQSQIALGLDGEKLPNSSTVKSEKLFYSYGKKARDSLALAEAYCKCLIPIFTAFYQDSF